MDDSWEARMSAKAKKRIALEELRRRAGERKQRAAEEAAEKARMEEEAALQIAAGPPYNCNACWILWDGPYGGSWSWWHIGVDTEDGMCDCACHPEWDRYHPVIAFG